MIAAGIGAIGSIGGAAIGAVGASSAASKQAAVAQQALNLQQQQFNTGLQNVQPFQQAGASVLPLLTQLLTPGANMTDVLSKIPGFQFASDWGLKGITNAMTGRGLGGNVLTAAGNYASGLAQNTYSGITSALQNLAGMGSSAASSIMGGAIQSGANQAQSLTNLGNAQASGILGVSNALSSGLGGLTSNFGSLALLSRLMGGGGSMYGGGGIFSAPFLGGSGGLGTATSIG